MGGYFHVRLIGGQETFHHAIQLLRECSAITVQVSLSHIFPVLVLNLLSGHPG